LAEIIALHDEKPPAKRRYRLSNSGRRSFPVCIM